MSNEDREVCVRCGADLLDNPSDRVGDDLCVDCRHEEDSDVLDGALKHADPAVQALIDKAWLGEWDRPVSIEDLENAVRLVREVDAGVRAS